MNMERNFLLRFRLDRSAPVPERESGHPAYCAKGIHDNEGIDSKDARDVAQAIAKVARAFSP